MLGFAISFCKFLVVPVHYKYYTIIYGQPDLVIITMSINVINN